MQAREGETRQHPNGGTYRRQNGQWVLISAPASPFGAAPDAGYKVTQEQYQAQAAPYVAQRAQTEAQVAAQTAPYDARIAAANAAKAEAEAEKTRRDLQSNGNLTEAQTKAMENARAKLAGAATIDRQMGKMKTLFDQHFAGTGIRSLGEYLPTEDNREFSTIADAMSVSLKPLIRGPGEGTWTDADQALLDRLTPRPGNTDARNQALFDELQNLVKSNREQFAPMLPPEQREQAERGVDDPINAGLDTQVTTAAGQRFATERDQRFHTLANTWLRQGISVDEANKRARELGYTGDGNGGPPFLSDQWNEGLKYNKGRSPNAPMAQVGLPQSGVTDPTIMNRMAGSAGGAALGGYLNGVTGGFLDEGVGAVESLRTGRDMGESIADMNYRKSLQAQAHPTASFLGNVAGGLTTGLAGGAALGRFAPGLAQRFAAGRTLSAPNIAADAGYGALYGAGEQNEDRAGGALFGGAAGALGGIGGRAAMRGTASAIAPTGGTLAPLYQQGIRPTIGQRFGQSGVMGRFANTAEQAMQSIPFAGSMVQSARQGARDQFETGAFKRALGEIGETLPDNAQRGPEAFRFAREAFNNIYDRARSGMRFVPDGEYSQQFGQWQQNVLGGGVLDREGVEQAQKIISTSIGSRMRNGALEGDAYKTAISDFSKKIGQVRRPELKEALTEYRGILDNAARRHSDPNAVQLMDAADRGYSQYKPLKDAAKMAGNDTGRFTPKNLESVERRGMGGTNAFLEGDTRMGDYISSGRALSDTLPNSGTADRLLATQAATGIGGGGLASAGLVDPMTFGAMAAPSILYAPGIRKGIGEIMAPRKSEAANQYNDWLRKKSRIGGMFGAPMALQWGQ